MGEASENLKVTSWGVLFIRLLLGGVLVAHGLLRLMPSQAEKASELLLAKEVLGPQASLVVVGAGEIFAGFLLFAGLFVRLAVIPVVAYLAVMLVHAARKEPLLAPGGSAAEEHLILLGMAVALLILGPGRLSLQRFFRA